MMVLVHVLLSAQALVLVVLAVRVSGLYRRVRALEEQGVTFRVGLQYEAPGPMGPKKSRGSPPAEG